MDQPVQIWPDADGTLQIELAGDIDYTNSSAVVSAIKAAAIEPGPPAIRIDLDAVTFLDSSGIGVLIITSQLATSLSAEFRVGGKQRDAPTRAARPLHVADLRVQVSQALRFADPNAIGRIDGNQPWCRGILECRQRLHAEVDVAPDSSPFGIRPRGCDRTVVSIVALDPDWRTRQLAIAGFAHARDPLPPIDLRPREKRERTVTPGRDAPSDARRFDGDCARPAHRIDKRGLA